MMRSAIYMGCRAIECNRIRSNEARTNGAFPLMKADTPRRPDHRGSSLSGWPVWRQIRATHLILACVVLCCLLSRATRAAESYGVWFAPDGASPDLLELFRRPELWSQARSQIDVFKFGPLRLPRQANVKRNS